MDRYSSAKKASLFGIVGNLFLLIIKGIVGFMSSSQSMIADSVNSAGDILSSLMTFIGNKIASRPSDDDHNLGHGKAEYIYSMLISVVMILVAGKILIDSFFSFINKEKYISSIWLIIVCIITIIVKACLYLYTSKISKKYNNLLVEANSKDHRNDCIITTFNLISCLLSTRGIYFLDGVVGMIISLWIMVTSFQIFKESYDVLMDKSLSIETREKVLKIIRKNKQIKKINHFNATPVGYRYQISFTIFVDGNMSTFESHEIADNLEREIARELPEIYLTIIHVNPI